MKDRNKVSIKSLILLSIPNFLEANSPHADTSKSVNTAHPVVSPGSIPNITLGIFKIYFTIIF